MVVLLRLSRGLAQYEELFGWEFPSYQITLEWK